MLLTKASAASNVESTVTGPKIVDLPSGQEGTIISTTIITTPIPNRVMSRIARSDENCEIYDNSQCKLFKELQGSPVQSYKNCENYEIYEKCEIYDNS